MDGPIVPIETFNLVPADADKHAHRRLGKSRDWTATWGRHWHTADPKAYRDAVLTNGETQATVAAYLTTARGRCSEILRDKGAWEALHGLASRTLQETEQADTPANRRAFVDEIVTRLEDATDPHSVLVRAKTYQGHLDADCLRLTAEQVSAAMAAPAWRCYRRR